MTSGLSTHPITCFCDDCIKNRVKQRVHDEMEKEEAQKREEQSQAYIKRRGGVDPRQK